MRQASSITNAEIDSLRADSRFIARELLVRGARVRLYDFQTMTLVAELGDRRRFLVGGQGPNVPASSAFMADDKYVAKRRLEDAGFSVPRGNRFLLSQLGEAMLFAMNLGFPVVVKPLREHQGIDVHVGLRDVMELEEAVRAVCRTADRDLFLLEEEVLHREELRVFVSISGAYAVLRRQPAFVVGNGYQCIARLVDDENARRMNPRTTCLGAIHLDERARAWLARSGREPSHVPREGEKVGILGHVEGSGAAVEDITDRVHLSLIEICRRALQVFDGLPYAGFDLFSKNPTVEQGVGDCAFLEINTRPALGLHMSPGQGVGRDVASAIVDLLYPETRSGVAGHLEPCRMIGVLS